MNAPAPSSLPLVTTAGYYRLVGRPWTDSAAAAEHVDLVIAASSATFGRRNTTDADVFAISDQKSVSRRQFSIKWNTKEQCFKLKGVGKRAVLVDKKPAAVEFKAVRLQHMSCIAMPDAFKLYFLLPQT